MKRVARTVFAKGSILNLETTWRKAAALIIVGVIASFVSVAVTGEVYKHTLLTRADTIAAALDTARIDQLKRVPANQPSADYDYIKAKLAAVKQANDGVRFVYLMARDNTGQIYFLADSEVPGTAGYSPRGQAYPDASPALKRMFDTNTDVIEGPVKDSYGTWLSALSPVINDQNYGFVGVLGMDVPAASYWQLLSLAGGIPIVLALLLVAMVLVTDHSRRRRMETMRFRAELVSIASHELRTPLTGLCWTEENLLQEKLPAKAAQTLQDMYVSTLRLQESIEDVLQMASLTARQAGRLTLRQSDLRAMLDRVCDMQKLAAERRGIRVHYAAGWPKQVPVMADEQRLKRALNNVVSNSVKYSKPHSSVRVSYDAGKAPGMHTIIIEDHGIGIPVHEQGRVFGGFYRASNAEATAVGGTGMGLYMSLQVVEQHGGKLWLESKEGKGTKVYVQLPKLPKATTSSKTSSKSA